MKKALAIAGILALSITPTASFADHLSPNQSEIRPGGNLAHTNLSRFRLSGANLSGANLSGADLMLADLSGITATNLRGCPWRLPDGTQTGINSVGTIQVGKHQEGWVCENNSLIQR